MTLSDYLVELEATKARKEKLIAFEPYTVKWSITGRPRDNYPRADKEHHVIVIDFHKNRPALSCVLTDKKTEMDIDKKPTVSDSNKLLFIYVNMKPQTLTIDSPQGGYRLEDGHHINASLNVTYRVSNAEIFWMESNDSLLEFEKMIINQAKNYFFGKKSIALVSNPIDFKKMLERQRFDEEIEGMKEYFEGRMLKKGGINGIEIVKIHADIKLSKELEDFLKIQHDSLYDPTRGLLTNITKNMLIDQAIENYTYFSPYNLMDVVNFLGSGLRNNFYSLPWNSAIQKVEEELKKKRMFDKDAKVKDLCDKIDIAVNNGVEKTDIKKLQDKLANELLKDDDINEELFCNIQYLSRVMPKYLATKQLAQESYKLIKDDNGNVNLME